MNYVLIITNELNGQTEIINKLFSSVQEANQYVAENNLILYQIVTEQQYQMMEQNYQQQKQPQRYQRSQIQYQQNPHERILVQEREPEITEPLPQPRPPRTVGIIFKPRFASNLRFNPVFVSRKRRIR